ncbi:MAG: hypothetical protein CME71_06790 [Halobacteriovorax sp.]|nr:hypothetical protein [Halobacteriovorax sp.]
MKLSTLFLALALSTSAAASVNCDIYLVASDVDGRHDLTEKVLSQFEAKGYRISRIEKPSDIQDQGKVSYMSVFSDIHPLIGARTTIDLVDLYVEENTVTSKTQSKIAISKKPLFGSAAKSVLKAVEKSIPSCLQ